MLLASLTELFVKLSTHSEICDDDAILDQARQSQLRAMLDQAAIDCSAGFVPSTLSCFKFSILPDLSLILGSKSLPVCGQPLTSYMKTCKPNKDGGVPLKQGTTMQ